MGHLMLTTLSNPPLLRLAPIRTKNRVSARKDLRNIERQARWIKSLTLTFIKASFSHKNSHKIHEQIHLKLERWVFGVPFWPELWPTSLQWPSVSAMALLTVAQRNI